jgi:hypothetical protein
MKANIIKAALLGLALAAASVVQAGSRPTSSGAFYGIAGGVSSSADLELNIGTKLIFDADGTANDYLTAVSDNNLIFYVSGGAVSAWTTSGILLYDNKAIRLGTSADQTLTYADGTGVTWNDGTNDVLVVADDTGSVSFGVDLNLANAEFIDNDTDGKITLGGAGGTNNEDIVLDFETTPNYLEITSGTGVSIVDFNSLSVASNILYSSNHSSLSGMSVAGLHFDPSADQVILGSGSAYGRQLIVADAVHFGKDYDHAALTDPVLYIHSATDPDSDNTEWLSLSHNQTDAVIASGKGSVKVDSPLLKNSAEISHFVSIDADDTPYTVLATDLGIVCDPDSGSVPGDVTISLPASAGAGRRIFVKNIGTTFDCLVDPNGTEQIDASGSGTAVAVDTKASLTLKDVGVSTFEWVIE